MVHEQCTGAPHGGSSRCEATADSHHLCDDYGTRRHRIGLHLRWRQRIGCLLIGTIVVVAFFGGGQYVVTRVLRNNPMIAMNTALLVYLVQMAVMFGLILLLQDATFFNPKAFALTIVACALVWTVAMVIAMTRSKVLYVEPGSGPVKPLRTQRLRIDFASIFTFVTPTSCRVKRRRPRTARLLRDGEADVADTKMASRTKPRG